LNIAEKKIFVDRYVKCICSNVERVTERITSFLKSF